MVKNHNTFFFNYTKYIINSIKNYQDEFILNYFPPYSPAGPVSFFRAGLCLLKYFQVCLVLIPIFNVPKVYAKKII